MREKKGGSSMVTKIGGVALGCLTATGCATSDKALEALDATTEIEIHLTQKELDNLKEQCNGFVAKNGRAVTLSTEDYPNISKVVGSNLGKCTITEDNGKFQLSPLPTNIVKPASDNTKTVTISSNNRQKGVKEVKNVTKALVTNLDDFFNDVPTDSAESKERLKKSEKSLAESEKRLAQKTLKEQEAFAKKEKSLAEVKIADAQLKASKVYSKATEIIKNAQNENTMLKGLEQILDSLTMNHSDVAEFSGENIKTLISAIQTNHNYQHNDSIKDMIEKILKELNKPKQIRRASF